MFTHRYFWKSGQQSRAILVGLVCCTTFGLQSCNFLQTQTNSESGKPSVTANQGQGTSSALSRPLPTAKQGQIPNLKQPISAGPNNADINNQLKVDPITGLPAIADSPDASDPATSAMDPSLRNSVAPTTGRTTTSISSLNLNTAKDSAKPLLKSTTSSKPVAAKTPAAAKGSTTQANVTTLNPSTNEPFGNALPTLQPANSSDAAAANPGGSAPSSSSPVRSSFGDPSGFSSGNSSSSNSGSANSGMAIPGNGSASTSTAANSAGFGSTATSSSGSGGGTPSTPSNTGSGNAGSGYVYDPSTAAYRPANSLPVWSPSGNAANSPNPTQPPSSP